MDHIFRVSFLPDTNKSSFEDQIDYSNVIDIFSGSYLPDMFRVYFPSNTKKSSFEDQIVIQLTIKSSKDGIKDHIKDTSDSKIASEVEDQIEDPNEFKDPEDASILCTILQSS